MRDTLINTFVTAYKLKTMPMGAIVREWPNGYSVWLEDAGLADGYRILESYLKVIYIYSSSIVS